MKRIHIGLLAASLLASACGGGGGSTFGGAPPVSESFTIDSSNGVAAARQSYGAVMASGGIAEIGGAAGISSAPSDGAAIAQQATPEDVVLDVVSLVPFGPDVQPCLGGTGTVTLSGDIAAPGTLTPGDFFVVEYELCDEGEGEVIDGIITLTVRDFSGDFFLGTYQLSMDADVDTLSVATGTDNVTADGQATVTLDTTDAPFITTGVSGSQMTQTSNAGTETLTSFSSNQTLDGNQEPPEYTMDASGTLDSSQLPGSVTYSTELTFRGFAPAYPGEGVLLVSGDNSFARLIVLDENNVRIEIDSNGDGEADDMFDMTWDEFINPAT
jgi:hypothetical protein